MDLIGAARQFKARQIHDANGPSQCSAPSQPNWSQRAMLQALGAKAE